MLKNYLLVNDAVVVVSVRSSVRARMTRGDLFMPVNFDGEREMRVVSLLPLERSRLMVK
jgi:hypothetical protein